MTLNDPYWLEKKHYLDRPYPVTSPAFSDVPLVGPMRADLFDVGSCDRLEYPL